MTDSGVSDEVRGTLALALDVDDLVAATRLGRELKPWFGVAKIGLELYSAAGPDAVGALRELGNHVLRRMAKNATAPEHSHAWF